MGTRPCKTAETWLVLEAESHRLTDFLAAVCSSDRCLHAPCIKRGQGLATFSCCVFWLSLAACRWCGSRVARTSRRFVTADPQIRTRLFATSEGLDCNSLLDALYVCSWTSLPTHQVGASRTYAIPLGCQDTHHVAIYDCSSPYFSNDPLAWAPLSFPGVERKRPWVRRDGVPNSSPQQDSQRNRRCCLMRK